jgi:hypothetical protein
MIEPVLVILNKPDATNPTTACWWLSSRNGKGGVYLYDDRAVYAYWSLLSDGDALNTNHDVGARFFDDVDSALLHVFELLGRGS